MNSSYLKNENRLADVIAAIQVLAVYKFYKLSFAGWADRIVGDRGKAEYWKQIFQEHPEFFRLDQSRTKASLTWRRNFPKIYNVDTQETILVSDYLKLSEEKRKRISRRPLTNSDVQTLINSAINLNNTALEDKKTKDWWKVPTIALIGVLIGLLAQLL